jgi:hypothetical protein
VYIFSHAQPRDHILLALQDQRSCTDMAQIRAIVRQERDPRKMVGKERVHPAETRLQFSGKLRALRISHDQRRHRCRPRNVIAFKCFEQSFDIASFKTADVFPVVDVAWRRPHHRQGFEPSGFLDRGESANHRTHGMSDEVDRPELEF